MENITVYTSIKDLAVSAAELAAKIAKNEKLDIIFDTINNNCIDVPSIILNPIVVDFGNINTSLIHDTNRLYPYS